MGDMNSLQGMAGAESDQIAEEELMDIEEDIDTFFLENHDIQIGKTNKGNPEESTGDLSNESTNLSKTTTDTNSIVSEDSKPLDSDDEDEIQEVTIVQKTVLTTVLVQSVAKKRTCVPPPPVAAPTPKQYKKKQFGELKFMADFDPSNSSRNQQKKKKRYHPLDGRLIQYADDFEDCDCLRSNCTGCHYPCNVCGDSRCGHECRQSRRWLYESVEVDGMSLEFKNQHTNSFC